MPLWPSRLDNWKLLLCATLVIQPSAFAILHFGTPPEPWTPGEFMTSGLVLHLCNFVVFANSAVVAFYLLRMNSGIVPDFRGALRKPARHLLIPILLASLVFGVSIAIASSSLVSAGLITSGMNLSMMTTEGSPIAVLGRRVMLLVWAVSSLVAFALYARAAWPKSSPRTV